MKDSLIILIVFGTLTTGIVPAAEIQLRSTAHPAGSLLVLGDVAEVFARDAAEADTLKQVELFPAPALGNKRYVRLREIQDAMERRGISLAEHVFSGANQVTVSVEAAPQPAAVLRVSTAYSAVELRRAHQLVEAAVVRYLEANASAQESWSVELNLDDDAVRAVLAAGKIESLSGGQAPWTGTQTFVAQIVGIEGKAALAVKANVSVVPAVVVATRSVPRGAVIQASDVQLDRSQQLVGKSDAVTSLDAVVGKEAAQALVAGRPIDAKDVRQPVLVRKGEVVTVYVRSPGVQVRTAARAKDTGSQGELISVESLENRQTYLARVTGIQEAEVYARGQSAM